MGEPLRDAGAAVVPIDGGGDRAVRVWLIVVACLVFGTVIVGGATRLTDSGLSITEWLPILGAIPPLSEAAWLEAFEKYKQIPEYTQVNQGMTLDEFKEIYWWEWSHRFLGRFIGIVMAVPLVVFWGMGKLRKGWSAKLIGVLCLGGLQGLIGWYMVKSGLVDRVDVSQYRLALHLFIAFLILGVLTWLIVSLAPSIGRDIYIRTQTGGQRLVAWLIVGLVFLQVVLGAFVAGTKAGLGYNTWPMMDGQFVPDGLFALSPWYLNALENVVAIQFDHRIVAYGLLVLAVWHAISVWRTSDDPGVVRSGVVLVASVIAQAVLGVVTLLAVPDSGGIPLGLGLVHQGGAAVVTVIAVWHLHRMLRA